MAAMIAGPMSAPTDAPDLDGVVAQSREGALLRVRVAPRSRRRGVRGVVGSELSVAVGVPPEGGRATTDALVAVAEWLGLPRSQLTLTSGAASRSKRFLVRGVSAPALRARLAERLRENPR